ncbi:7-keto-8-aminopelargonate synthetase [Maribacter sedimenticola]|uniref:7-keto-8-aminopelargonate synthetase n=1 Tax=Maribacter sedimenticola TaxID=228956 RepID=A0ABY1SFE2_9FLAO|nr:aminotransferase class I/II-fold pyridoxal phosphate-dependent enzyme [Maribacter sedimenticola]SNR41505.1 7-keto-8-aminopelargonate synthetase [Maribacter sedimenticola]
MHILNEFPGREVKIGGKNYLYFGGTSYLGLQTNMAFQALYLKNMKRYGTGYGASRKSNIKLSVYDEVEHNLAHIVGSEQCMTMSSGYLAGQLIYQYLYKNDHKLFYAPQTHSALSNEMTNKYATILAMITDLKKFPNQEKIILLDSIDFNGQHYPDYHWLTTIPLQHTTLVVDDSHGIGITGINGGGSYRFLQSLNPKNLVVSCSLGKGYGIGAGAIFGSNTMIERLRDTEMYGGSSPAAPAALATIKDAEHIIHEKQLVLQKNLTLFTKNVQLPSLFKFSTGHPTFSFQNEQLTLYLEKNGIIVTNFRYPTCNDAVMSRIVISALNTAEDILTLCDTINRFDPS